MKTGPFTRGIVQSPATSPRRERSLPAGGWSGLRSSITSILWNATPGGDSGLGQRTGFDWAVPAASWLRAPAAQLPQHLLAGGDGVQELPLPLLHRVQQLLSALIPGRLLGGPPAEPQPRLPTVHAGSLPVSFNPPGGRGPFKWPGAGVGPPLLGRKLKARVTSSRK